MSLQARKLRLIEYLIPLKDETIFNSIEQSVKKLQEKQSYIFSEEKLLLRAEEAGADCESGNVQLQESLEKESEKW